MPNDANWRSHSRAQERALEGALGEVGWVAPVLVNQRSGRLVDGHLRVERALAHGEPAIPVTFVDLSEEEERFALATLDPLAAMAGADPAKLAALLAQVTPDDEALAAMLADLAHTYGILPTGLTDPDEIPAPPEVATTQPGDLWVMGAHRLLCGDAGNPDDLDRLLGGVPVDLVHTDPPYNVRVEPRSNNAIAAGLSSFPAAHHQRFDRARHPGKARPTQRTLRAKDRPLANDFLSRDAFAALLRAWFGNLARVLRPGGAFYLWGGYANLANYPAALEAAGLYFSQTIIWVKEHPVLTRKDFMGNHEWCFYGWREGAAHHFYGPPNVPDTWSVQKVAPQAMCHLTEKPVELARRALEYSSPPDAVVLDPFAGSGSTVIAAQQTGRRAYLAEIDPLYCDVIVERWEAFTGRAAVRHG
ncbi:MAG: DNA modification methylase [Candidatus Limnocylindrales bacterium]